jgi:hypothetical protein
MTTSILILLAIISISGILVMVLGTEKLTWRYYLRNILVKKPDLQDMYPYQQMFSGQKLGKSINTLTEIASSCFEILKYGREWQLHLQPAPVDADESYYGVTIVSSQDNVLNEIIGGRKRPLKMGASISVPAKKNVRAMIGLTPKKNETGMPVVIMDCPNNNVINFFGKKMAKVYFTAVEDDGNNDEAHFRTYLWMPADKYFYLRFEADHEGLRWYVNGYLVKYHPNNLPENYLTKTVAFIVAADRVNNLEKETLKIRF